MQLLHPFMPFVTEELWQRLPSPRECKRPESIMICNYPSAAECWNNERVEDEMGLVESAVKSLMSQANESCDRRPAFALCQTQVVEEIVIRHKLEIVTLANLSSLTVINENDDVPSGYAVSLVNEGLSVYLELQGNISSEEGLEKIKKHIDELRKKIERLEKIINAPGYEDKVPPHIQDGNIKKLECLVKKLDTLLIETPEESCY